ncbi:GNAT family N-acetyltransferase [Flavobacteriaceae bacterium]|nr:GNAT family N-acetyltransferase [Flavobacteriaceae bacterium]
MIKKLDHTNLAIATKMRVVFQESYAVEAALLNATNFPPLQRPLESYIKSTTTFFGYHIKDEIVGIVEVSPKEKTTHINSLVVSPHFFRQGIGRELMNYILQKFSSKVVTVETGFENIPASKLYISFHFKEVKQWDTDHGVRKIRFKLSR